MNLEISLIDDLSTGARFIYEIKMMSVPDTIGVSLYQFWDIMLSLNLKENIHVL